MGNCPLGVSAPTAVLFLGMDAAMPAPLPAGELGATHDTGELLDGVEVPNLLPFDQNDQHRFETFQPGENLFVHHPLPEVPSRVRSASCVEPDPSRVVLSVELFL